LNPDSKKIEISSVRVVPLEKCLADIDVVNNKRRLESTLLHEMVRWVRNKANLMAMDWDNFPDFRMEAEDQFEIWAYGTRQCTEDEISDAAWSYR
jgi:hypothetical protein